MQSNTPAPQEPTLAQKQAQLAENLAKVDRAQARRHAKAAPPQPSLPARRISSAESA